MKASFGKLYNDKVGQLHRETDRIFGWLLGAQWLIAIILALVSSPWSYSGTARSVHVHVILATVGGAVINSVPWMLLWLRPGAVVTRHCIAFAQMMWSATLIAITGGRIETHFHIFGSLAFLAFYADWRILVTATVTVAADHLLRGLLWPDSVYGLANPEWWRFLEHATWVMFEDIVLVIGCHRTLRGIRKTAHDEAQLAFTNASIERRVEERTAELAESSERYRTLVENTHAIPFEYDTASKRMIYIAPRMARVLEIDPEQMNGELLATLAHPDDRERVRAAIRSFASGAATSGEPIDCRALTSHGQVRELRMFLSDRTSDGTRVRGIVLDVTRQKALETELRHAQKLESVGRLAAGVAHEINTPIQFIGDSVQFARDALTDLVAVTDKYRATADGVLAGSSDVSTLANDAVTAAVESDLDYLVDQLPKALERALDGTSRVATIVRSMRAFAHPDATEPQAIDLNEAVRSTLVVARSEYKNVAEVVIDCAVLPPVTCWVGDLNQVVLNLVVNASHAIADKVASSGERGTIRVATELAGTDVIVSISDDGTGIPAAIRDRIFDPFFTTKGVGGGTGQGLALARSIVVDKHHGSLTFDTVMGEGTTFHIQIPVRPPVPMENAA